MTDEASGSGAIQVKQDDGTISTWAVDDATPMNPRGAGACLVKDCVCKQFQAKSSDEPLICKNDNNGQPCGHLYTEHAGE